MKFLRIFAESKNPTPTLPRRAARGQFARLLEFRWRSAALSLAHAAPLGLRPLSVTSGEAAPGSSVDGKPSSLLPRFALICARAGILLPCGVWASSAGPSPDIAGEANGIRWLLEPVWLRKFL